MSFALINFKPHPGEYEYCPAELAGSVGVPVKAGTQERGTEVKCGPRAIIARRASLFTGQDWTHPKICFPV